MSNTTDEIVIADTTPPESGTLSLAELMQRGSVTQMSLPDLLESADFIVGRALTAKEALLGVPLAITGLAFRCVREAGTVKGEQVPARDYVSVEYVAISDDPNRCVEGVFNDGSTGVRRQIVTWLQGKGVIPEGTDPDLAVATVKTVPSPSGEVVSGDVILALATTPGLKPLVAPRGLRKSEYDGPEGPTATYYLA